MIPPSNPKIALYLLTGHPFLGVLRAGGVFRLVALDDLRIDPDSMDVLGEGWTVRFEEFADGLRIVNDEDFPELANFYPISQTQQILSDVWKGSAEPDATSLATLMRMFKPVQHGKMVKD